MPVRVVDASALGALVFGEPEAEEISKALGEAPLVAPELLWFELASVCLKKIQAHPAQADQLLAGFKLADQLGIEAVAVDHVAVIALARNAGLTTYDASYLWLAGDLGGEFVTLDKKLRKLTRS